MCVVILHRSERFCKLIKLNNVVLIFVKPQEKFINFLRLWEHTYSVQPFMQTLFIQFAFKDLIGIRKIKVEPLHESNFLTIKLSFYLR